MYWQATSTAAEGVYAERHGPQQRRHRVPGFAPRTDHSQQAGLPTYGTRRVPGLRREEVASLAGVSVEYYKRLERGNLSGVSDLVLEGLANALALDDAEREHLFDLARAASRMPPRRRRAPHRGVRPNVQRIRDALDTPAVARAALSLIHI